jgi:hypothetical protein
MRYKVTQQNQRRAARIEAALACYGSDDAESMVRDFLEDLLHWQAQRDPRRDPVVTLSEAFRVAVHDFPFEASGKG